MFPLLVAGEALEYELLYSQRRTMTLRVHPDLRITVDAPLGMTPSEAHQFVLKHRTWIARKRAKLREGQAAIAPTHTYQDGDAFLYLGQQIPLAVEADRIERVRLVAGTLYVGTKTPQDRLHIREQISVWYRRRADALFPDLLRAHFAELRPMLGPARAEPALRIRAMKTRWGSCTRAGTITLNTALIQMPEALISYVVVHELCHLVEFNHGPRFWALVASTIPDYKGARRALRSYASFDFF